MLCLIELVNINFSLLCVKNVYGKRANSFKIRGLL